jgi:hypothetical protein
MRLGYILIFIASHIAHSLALEVIYQPNELTDQIIVYDLTREDDECCACHNSFDFYHEDN